MTAAEYDAFLSHSTSDKPLVEALAKWLVNNHIQPWFDKWHLIPGVPWQPEIEQALAASKSCVVIVGPSGLGPWQHEEMRAAISRRVSADPTYRVIPVLLPGARKPEGNDLPSFLSATMWVEFSSSIDDEQALHRLVCGIRGIEPGIGPGDAIIGGRCPYLGLRHFEETDAPLFYGRRASTDGLIRRLQDAAKGKFRYRFLGVVGSSGSGKSSLVRAGLLPAIRAGKVGGSSAWKVVLLRPGHDPTKNIAAALKRDLQLNESVTDIIAAMRTSAESLDLFVRSALPEDSTHKLVLVLDQFEEAFTICRDPIVRQAAIDNLMYAADLNRNPDGRTIVVLAMRADFYGKCTDHRELSAAISQNQLFVVGMADDELREVIEQPARLVGCDFEPGLIDTLIRDLHNQAGALPLLEHVLREVWHRRSGHRLTHAGYNELGKLAGALELKADEAFDALSTREQEICQHIFLRLTRLGEGTEDTKQRVPLADLVPVDSDLAEVGSVVASLTAARLLTVSSDGPGGEPAVEVAHESLIGGWSRLRAWLNEDREALRGLQRLADAVREWTENDRHQSYLFLGQRLVNAENWLQGRASELNPLEKTFMTLSRSQAAVERLTTAPIEQVPELLEDLRPAANELRPILSKLFGQSEEGTLHQKNYALAMVATGDFSVLRHSPHPDLRTQLIHVLPALGLPVGNMLEQLRRTDDESIRRTIVLTFGEYHQHGISDDDVEAMTQALVAIYGHAKDPGLLSAIEWSLKAHGQAVSLTTGQGTDDSSRDCRWYQTCEGHTMIVIGTENAENVTARFALSSKPVTVDRFLRFRKEHDYDSKVSSELQCPINQVSWFDAAAYCNWLSKREGIPEDQWCYQPNDDGEFAEGMQVVPEYLSKNGYRLPTEGEWEYACRAGSAGVYCFGDSVEMLDKYSCYSGNSDDRTAPVGSFKPNDFGFFDMHGNVWEWCQSRYTAAESIDEVVANTDGRVLRGGSWGNSAGNCGCSSRFHVNPYDRNIVIGFRLARTYS